MSHDRDPLADASEAVPDVGTLAICPSCLRTLVVEGEVVRLASGQDTVHLSTAELDALKARRKAMRKDA